MAFDEKLAARVRTALRDETDITEKRMFGGIAFLKRGYMFVGLATDSLMARVGPENYEQVLEMAQVREMDFTGKPMRGYVYVAPSALASDSALVEWLKRCAAFVDTLPPKEATRSKRKIAKKKATGTK